MIYSEIENNIAHNNMIKDNNADNKDNNNEGAPTVSILIVLMKDKRISKEIAPRDKKKLF